MNPMELLASQWIWYALFGLVALVYFVRIRSRRLATMAGMESGWPPSHAGDHAHHQHDATVRPGVTASDPEGDVKPSDGPAHTEGGHRRHGCC